MIYDGRKRRQGEGKRVGCKGGRLAEGVGSMAAGRIGGDFMKGRR